MKKEIINTVKVSKVLYHNQANGWGVFSYVNDNMIPELTSAEVKVAGVFKDVFQGTTVSLTGTIVIHPTYGAQINLINYQVLSQDENSLRIFLQEIVGEEVTSQLIRQKNNVYSILRGINLPLPIQDEIAGRLGVKIQPDNDERLMSGLIYSLRNKSILSGSTGCSYQELREQFVKDLGLKDFNLYPYTLNLLEQEGLVIVDFNRVFLTAYYNAEKEIAFILKLLNKPQETRDYNLNIIYNYINSFPFQLNQQQIDAINHCISHQFSVITGQAGSGKSSITKAIVQSLKAHGENVVLISPTGQASKRLSECTNYKATTIHRFLQLKKDIDIFSFKPEKLDLNTTVIVDEISMVDVILFKKVLETFRDDTRLIIIGDYRQLPSIQAGNILADIINSNNFHINYLTDVMRQSETSDIIKNCHKINEDIEIQPYRSRDFIYLNFNSREQLLNTLINLYDKSVRTNGLKETQVIGIYHLKTLGIKALNEILKGQVNFNKDEFSGFTLGDKVRHTKNNYDKQVFNGDVGIVTQIHKSNLIVSYDSKDILYTKKDLQELTLSYAATVHSSQGSEYNTVFVVLDNEVSNILLIRKLLYTAVSRAKKRCVILSTGDCVNMAIHNDYDKPRITKLCEFLTGENDDNYFN